MLFHRPEGLPQQNQEALHTLGLTTGAADEQIKAQYRKLAGEYHPDRLGHVSPGLRELAEQKMKAINLAYQTLVRPGTAAVVPMTAHDTHEFKLLWDNQLNHRSIVACPLCRQSNRLPAQERFKEARCGRCFGLLLLPEALGKICLEFQKNQF